MIVGRGWQDIDLRAAALTVINTVPATSMHPIAAQTIRLMDLTPIKHPARQAIGTKKNKTDNNAPSILLGVTPITAMYRASSHE